MQRLNFFPRIVRFFTQHPLWLKLIAWTQTHSLPGLKRIPIYNLVLFINDEIKEDAIVTRANSMAFSFFLAIFPGLIMLISLLPYFPISMDFFGTLQTSIKQIMPGSAGKASSQRSAPHRAGASIIVASTRVAASYAG